MDQGAQLADQDPRITALTLERARTVGAPLTVIGITTSLVLSVPSGIPLPPPVIVANGITIGLSALGWMALAGHRVPAERAHLALATLWLLAVSNTLTAQFFTGHHNLIFPFLLELAFAPALMVSPRWLAGAMFTAIGAWMPLALRDAGPDFVAELSSMLGVISCSVVICRYVRRSLDTAFLRQEEQERTAAQLKLELAERQRAELERERLRDQFVLAQRQEAVGTLAAGLAHDMNNILGIILTQSELLLEADLPERIRAELGEIVKGAERGAELTRSLLAYARHGPYVRRILGLDEILSGVAPLLNRLTPKRVRLEWSGGTTACVDGDPAQLQQVLVNLCVNATQAIDGQGVVTITTDELSLDGAAAARLGVAPGPFARVSVTDTGAGMSDAVRARVFEPFFTTKPVTEGTGLGLAMVQGTVLAHGGAIEVESSLGAGSTFRVYLPALPPAAPRTNDGGEQPRSARTQGTVHVVLVVDDEAGLRAVMARALERMGLRVITAKHGAEAVEVFEANRSLVHLVILDMTMPEMSGAECFRRLRALESVPVLLISGYADGAEVQEALAAGAAGFLGKPFRAEELRDKVRAILDVPAA